MIAWYEDAELFLKGPIFLFLMEILTVLFDLLENLQL